MVAMYPERQQNSPLRRSVLRESDTDDPVPPVWKDAHSCLPEAISARLHQMHWPSVLSNKDPPTPGRSADDRFIHIVRIRYGSLHGIQRPV